MYMGSDLFQSDDYDSRGDVATKYENYLPVDDLLAPIFFVRESEFLLFLHFSNCIANLRLHTFHSEDGDVEFFALLPLLFLSPIRQFQNCNPGNVPGRFTYWVDYSRICPPSGDTENGFRATLREKRGRQPASHKSSLATGEAPSGTHCRIS